MFAVFFRSPGLSTGPTIFIVPDKNFRKQQTKTGDTPASEVPCRKTV